MLSITRTLLSKPLHRALCTPNRQTIQRTSSSLQQPRSGNINIITNPATTKTTTSAVQQQRINYTTNTLPLQKQYTVPVPTMGDSITEGTIVEWIVPEGAAVSEGDVLCLIETDKVTVDIKAEKNGVLIRHLGEVEGVVEVGEGLYVLDEDASIAADVAAVADDADVEKRKEDAAAPTTTTINTVAPPSKTRVPSIHFLGKEGWKQVRSPQQQQQRQQIDIQSTTKTTTTVVPTTNQTKPHAPTSITYQPYVHMYGRPSITEEEMEALLLGGAEEAPVMRVGKDKVVTFYGGRIVTAGPRGVWLADEGEEGM